MERLDKVLSNLGYGSRKEIKAFVKKGEIEVDGKVVKDNGIKVDPNKSIIKVNGEEINYRKYIYIMMNKPAGVVSATFDNYDETVIDLLDYEYTVFDPFPVGRLDKDTEGLLLITNDGELNHRLTSPKWHVDKTYYAEIDKMVDEKDVEKFKKGITLDDGYKCLPAKLEILSSDENGSEVNITIQEGKFHQVKRMFEARGKNVVYLKRLTMGNISLDEELDEGTYRELTEEEIEILKSI
ncbi:MULTISPECIES: pseudouridine synthase [Clostridium]|uniref:Pseudouridine synthase n=1 Tax=Clostridium novyi (strain NT) TaxID=386415 RepID=A0Q2Q6_CLONN|nr:MULTISPECIES: pseudouridine synthase [Clostridium]ABK62452.1 RNA pseudouridylate synthase family protein [Clostridium novyi NT]KEH85768.1 pseudouridine synthase [Clostridium novyi A str. NCTC 538]KEH90851.1 pseudouridine synthase [Clostridium novyi A str. BKT29909]KEH93854.1 pseudouridine synthase [Clostridium botulinum C/D str. It1]